MDIGNSCQHTPIIGTGTLYTLKLPPVHLTILFLLCPNLVFRMDSTVTNNEDVHGTPSKKRKILPSNEDKIADSTSVNGKVLMITQFCFD